MGNRHSHLQNETVIHNLDDILESMYSCERVRFVKYGGEYTFPLKEISNTSTSDPKLKRRWIDGFISKGDFKCFYKEDPKRVHCIRESNTKVEELFCEM